jgi:hypothetical protein
VTLMGMGKTKKRLGLVWLTLFAFSVQMAVAVLHHHVARGSGLAARAMTAGMCAPTQRQPCAPANPLQQDNDGCVLCWATAVAASSLTPQVPELPVPQTVRAERLLPLERESVRQVHRVHFQARAPPSVSLAS